MTSKKLKHKTDCFNKKTPYLNYQDLELVCLFIREKNYSCYTTFLKKAKKRTLKWNSLGRVLCGKSTKKKKNKEAIKGSLILCHKTHGQSQPDYCFPLHISIPQHFWSPSSAFQSAGLRLQQLTQAQALEWRSWLYSLECMNKGLLQSKCIRVSCSVTPLQLVRREIDHDSEK